MVCLDFVYTVLAVPCRLPRAAGATVDFVRGTVRRKTDGIAYVHANQAGLTEAHT